MSRVAIRYLAVAAAFLVALWAFLSYLQPWFSGERMVELFLCFGWVAPLPRADGLR